MANKSLVLMTRYPEAGKVKTRLIPQLGAKGACALHKSMAEFVFLEALALEDVAVQVHFTGACEEKMELWLGTKQEGKEAAFISQVEGNLGERIFAAIKSASSCQIESPSSPLLRKKIVIIGSDCPENRCDNLSKAFELLDNSDCVLGPSKDGGYYLIAFGIEGNIDQASFLEEKIAPLFQDIDWGGPLVFAQSLSKIEQVGLSLSLLPELSDVDVFEDLPQKISVIIPTLNEENALENLFSSLPPSFSTQFIVADAHSQDKTREMANKYGAISLLSGKGRSQQMLAAAQKAEGEILFFLHADSQLPQNWDSKIRHALADTSKTLGYFSFAIAEDFWSRKIIERATHLRCKYLGLPYGDQGLFVRKKDFLSWNIWPLPILEDVYLVKKAREQGGLVALPDKLYTSGRRWFKHGFVRTTLINLSVLLCAKFGMNLEDIKEAYWKGENPFIFLIKKFFQSKQEFFSTFKAFLGKKRK